MLDKNTSQELEQCLQLAKSWLESSKSGNWLMVIDNLDDLKVPIGNYIPQWNGAILFTSQDSQISQRYRTERLNVEVMSDQEAIEAFFKLVKVDHDPGLVPEIEKLMKLIGNLPLAIAQAAAYIRVNSGSDRGFLRQVSSLFVLPGWLPGKYVRGFAVVVRK
jgi:hypothetical protein